MNYGFMSLNKIERGRMRFRVGIELESENVVIPYDHQYYLASYIYRVVERSDAKYSFELHRSRKYKHYTFSYLMSSKRENLKEGIKVGKEVYFYISSPDDEFIKHVVEGMLIHPEFRIKNVRGVVKEIKILKSPEIKHRNVFRTLSPIIIKKFVDKERWINLFPTDEEFYSRLKENLVNRYLDFLGNLGKYSTEHFLKDFDLNISIKEFKPKRHSINGTYHRGSLCEMVVEGNPELIKYGYEAGFGEKNAMGFGMVKVVG